MNNGSNRLAWLIAAVSVSVLLNAVLAGALVRTGADRAVVQDLSVKIDQVKEEVDRALPGIKIQLDRIQRDVDRLLSRGAGGGG